LGSGPAAFAVDAKRNEMVAAGDSAAIGLAGIQQAEQQVVSGMNHRLELKVRKDGENQAADPVAGMEAAGYLPTDLVGMELTRRESRPGSRTHPRGWVRGVPQVRTLTSLRLRNATCVLNSATSERASSNRLPR
jgi:hypothetical protein